MRTIKHPQIWSELFEVVKSGHVFDAHGWHSYEFNEANVGPHTWRFRRYMPILTKPRPPGSQMNAFYASPRSWWEYVTSSQPPDFGNTSAGCQSMSQARLTACLASERDSSRMFCSGNEPNRGSCERLTSRLICGVRVCAMCSRMMSSLVQQPFHQNFVVTARTCYDIFLYSQFVLYVCFLLLLCRFPNFANANNCTLDTAV